MTYQISKLKKDFQVLQIDSQATHSARYSVSASDMFQCKSVMSDRPLPCR